jgi:hypothetical protein
MLSRRAPFVLRAGFKQQYKKLPDSALGLFKGPDAEVVQIPWVKELFVPTTGELFANPDGFIEEVRILCKPWGITPGAVRASLSGLVSLTGCSTSCGLVRMARGGYHQPPWPGSEINRALPVCTRRSWAPGSAQAPTVPAGSRHGPQQATGSAVARSGCSDS